MNVDRLIPKLLRQLHVSQDIPKIFSIKGFLGGILNEKLPYSVFVDAWPEWTTIISKPKDWQVEGLPVYRLGLYTKNASTLENMLCIPGFLPHNVTIRIHGLPLDLVPTLKSIAQKLHLDPWFIGYNEPRYIIEVNYPYYLLRMMKFILDRMYSKELYMRQLNPKLDVESIIPSWQTYNFTEHFNTIEEGREAVKYYLHLQPAVGVFRKSDNKLISWTLRDLDYSGMIRVTSTEYRGSYVSHWAIIALRLLQLESNNITWAYITENIAKSLSKRYIHVHYSCPLVQCVLQPMNSRL